MDEPIDLETLTERQLLVLLVRLHASTVETLQSIEAALVVEAADDGCPHPEDRRVSLSTTSDPNHWVCALCKFDNKHDVMN